jgi:outer membrane biosynthesis protein TonB
MAHLILTALLWAHQAHACSPTKSPTPVPHGPPMPWTDGTSDPLWNHIDATKYGSGKAEPRAFATHSHGFPTHVPMPASSSTDIIMASLRDIVKALQNPSPRTPIAPRTDKQTQALLDVVTLLTNITPQPTESVAGPPLRRVDTPSPSAPNAPPLRVEPPENIPTHTPAPTPEDIPEPTPEPIPTPTPEPIPTSTPEPIPTPTPDPTPENLPAPTPDHTPAQPQDPTPDITYNQVTGPSGRRRRRRHRKQKSDTDN